MINKRITIQFIALTFGIAFFVSGTLIYLSQYGYQVYNWVSTFQEFLYNIPFAIYILSPAIASYLVLKRNHQGASLMEWLKNVFYVKNSLFSYGFVLGGLSIYFLIHIMVVKTFTMVLPFYTIFLSLPGNLIIGGLEEAGWMYILQPELEKKYGYSLASIYMGLLWIIWHLPLFLLPGTNHGDGLINIWMFMIQLMAFRFFNGAIYKISKKGCVFMCVLFHTLFNAVSPIFGSMSMTWAGTILANTVIIFLSVLIVYLYNKRKMFGIN